MKPVVVISLTTFLVVVLSWIWIRFDDRILELPGRMRRSFLLVWLRLARWDMKKTVRGAGTRVIAVGTRVFTGDDTMERMEKWKLRRARRMAMEQNRLGDDDGDGADGDQGGERV